MVDLNAHEAGNGGQKPREAYSSPSLLYSENALWVLKKSPFFSFEHLHLTPSDEIYLPVD